MYPTLNLIVPSAWQQLRDEQLRFVFHLLAENYSTAQIKTKCLLKWAGVTVVRHTGAIFVIKHKGKTYDITALQIAEAITTMTWLDDIPGYPVRLSRLNCVPFFRRVNPVRADLQDLSFGDFLVLDNLYQGYLQMKSPDLLCQMAEILYRTGSVTLTPEEEVCIFYWFASIKKMFAKMFHHFLLPINTDDGFSRTPSFAELQDSMNTQIRALTGGDITKEKEVLEMDCWRALTELNAKAKDFEEMKKVVKS